MPAGGPPEAAPGRGPGPPPPSEASNLQKSALRPSRLPETRPLPRFPPGNRPGKTRTEVGGIKVGWQDVVPGRLGLYVPLEPDALLADLDDPSSDRWTEERLPYYGTLWPAGEAMARYPRTQIDARSRLRLSGLYQYVNAYGHQVRLLEEAAGAFRGTEHEFHFRFCLGLTYLQGYHNPARAVACLREAIHSAKTDHYRLAAEEAMARSRKELAAREAADRSPWPKANGGVQCRLRPAPAGAAAGPYARVFADVQNVGAKVLWMPRAGGRWELEVDGVWYLRTLREDERRYWFGGGRQMYGKRIVLSKTWRSRVDGKPLAPAAGTHCVRVAFVAREDPWNARRTSRAVSNQVKIKTSRPGS